MSVKNILILLGVLIALGAYFYLTNTHEPSPKSKPRTYVWLIEIEEIEHITISLPEEGESQSFIKIDEEDKFPWYFDDPQRSEMNVERWGGGIPLLLSGPGTSRVISENTTAEKLAEFGLAQPQMIITLTLTDGRILNIQVGDSTPDGSNFYVQAPASNDVALVDYTWYGVLERLVKEPPYAPPTD